MAPPRKEASSGVGSLVASVKQHKKFRQLASYSVQCLCKVIAPGHLGWERNVKEAFEAGALEAITDVLSLHSGDQAVLLCSTQCLAAMASNPKYAGEIVASGAVFSMIESVKKAPDGDVVKDTLALMENIATHAPDALLAGGGMASATALLEAGRGVPAVGLAAVRTLEKLNKCPAGPAALAESGAVGALMDMLVRPAPDADSAELVETAMRTLDRLCRAPEYAEWVRVNYDGMRVLSVALEVHAANDKIAKAGGRLLSKLAAGNIPQLVAQLGSPGTPAAEKEFIAGLLANLALEEENAERIIGCGGIAALLRELEGGASSQKTKEACARAIARLAATESGTDALVSGGAIAILVRALGTNASDEAVVTALTPTLTRLAMSDSSIAAMVVAAGGVKAVVATLNAHPGAEMLATEAAGFFESLGCAEVDTPTLVGAGVIPALVAAMVAHPKAASVQLDGTRALIYLCCNEANGAAIGAAGGMEMALGNLGPDGSKDLVIASLYLITSLVLVPGLKERLFAAGGVDAVLTALAAYASHELVAETAQELLIAILDASQVGTMLAEFKAAVETAVRMKTKDAASKLKMLAGRLVAISSTPEFATLILDNGGVGALAGCLDGLAPLNSLPDVDIIMGACADALHGLVIAVDDNLDRVRAIATDSPAARAVVSAIKAQPKFLKTVTAGLSFLTAFAGIDPDVAEAIVENGPAVEAAIASARASYASADVVTASADLLLSLCSTDKSALAVARTGGTKAAMSAIGQAASIPSFVEPIEACLSVLQRVAGLSEGVDVLVKQGGVDACINASESYSAQAEGGAELVELAAKVLARLLNRDDVMSALEALAELAGSCRRGRLPAPDAIKPVVTRVTYMAAVSGYADLVVREGGAGSLADIIRMVLSKEDGDLKGDVLPVLFKCLANVAKGASDPIDDSHDFAGLISASIEGGFALYECLECIAAIASSESAAITLLSDGRTLPMVVETLRANMRSPPIGAACFGALAALGRHASTAPIIADAGALSLVSSWVDDNLYDAVSGTVEAAMSTLGAVTSSPAHYAASVDAATELVKAVVTRCVIEAPHHAVPGVLRSSVRVLLNSLAVGGAPAATRISGAGAVRRVVRGMSAHPGYLESAPCVLAVLELVRAVAVASPSLTGELLGMGAQELVVAGMNAHGTSEEVVRAGAAALGALGVGGEAGRAAIEEVRGWNAHIQASADVNEEMVGGLGDACRRLGNFLPVAGVVTPATAPGMMPVIATAAAILAEAGDMARPGHLASAVTSIGRIAELAREAVAPAVPDAISSVLDVLALAPGDDEATRLAGVHTLGLLGDVSVASLRAMYERGGMKAIQETARRFPGDRRLQGEVEATLDRLTDAVERNAAALLASPEGLRMLVAVIVANAGDQAKLEAMLLRLIVAMGTEEPLYDVLAMQAAAGAADIVNAVLGVLRSHYATTGMVPAGNQKRAWGLATSLQATITAQGALTSASDNRSKLQALRMAEGTLALLGALAWEPPGSATLFANNGIDGLMTLLAANIDDLETVGRILGILKGAMAFATHQGATQMAAPANMGAVVGSLALFLEAPQLVIDSIDVMAATARTTGPAASGIDASGMKAVTAASANYTDNDEVSAAVARLEAIMKVKFVEAEAATRLLLAALERLSYALMNAAGTTAAFTEDGRCYFYSAATGETTWEAPPAFAELQSAMTHLREVCKRQAEDSIATIEAGSITMLTGALATHARNHVFVDCLTGCLSVLTLNHANVATIAEVGGVTPVLQAVTVQPATGAEETLVALFTVLHRVAGVEAGRAAVGAVGGIDVLLEHGLGTFLSLPDVASKSLQVLLAVVEECDPALVAATLGSPKGSMAAFARVFGAYGASPRLLESLCSILACLTFGEGEEGEKAQEVVGGALGSHLCRCLATGLGDVALFKAAMRALSHLALADANVRPLVATHHAVRAVVMGMRGLAASEEAQAAGIEVIGTLAGLDEDPESYTGDSVQGLVLKDAGCAEIIATLRRFPSSSAVLTAGLDALASVAVDIEVTGLMASRQGLVPALIEVIQGHDYDEELMAHATATLAAVTYSRDVAVPLLVSADALALTLGLMQQHGANPDLLRSAAQALGNMAAADAGRAAIRDSETLLSLLLGVIESYGSTDAEFAEEAVKVLIRLTQADSGLSCRVAETGMHIVTGLIDAHADNKEFATSAFRLLGVLAFVESNLTIIVQHGGIGRVVGAITAHPDHQPLMVRAIQTLDNIASANKENAAIVIDEGGKELIEMIMSTYPEDAEIKRYGTSALSQLNALEHLTRSADVARKAALAAKAAGGPARPKDPLAEYRHLLSAGKVMKLWTRGVPKPMHFVVGADWQSITWQEPGSTRKLGAVHLSIMQAARPGTGEGHKKSLMSSKVVDPHSAFVIVGTNASLDLEAGNPRERDIWVAALSELLRVFRQQVRAPD